MLQQSFIFLERKPWVFRLLNLQNFSYLEERLSKRSKDKIVCNFCYRVFIVINFSKEQSTQRALVKKKFCEILVSYLFWIT